MRADRPLPGLCGKRFAGVLGPVPQVTSSAHVAVGLAVRERTPSSLREGMATMRPRVVATVILAIVIAASTCSESVAAAITKVPRAERPQPALGLSVTPTGWVPVAYGKVQVSVPASFSVAYPGQAPFCSPVGERGELLIAPRGTTATGGGCPAGSQSTLVSLDPMSHLPSKYANEKPIILNGVPVYLGPTGDPVSYVYYAPSLGFEVTAKGHLAHQVLGTLMASPRVMALAPGAAPSVPPSWHSVSFAGLRLSVPTAWPVQRTDTWNLCGPVGIAISQGVTLDTDKEFLALPCAAMLPFPVVPSEGVRVDSRIQGPTGSFSPGGACLHVDGLVVCPSSTPDYSILLLRVTVPGRATPDFVSIGLAGGGTVARTILYSLQTA